MKTLTSEQKPQHKAVFQELVDYTKVLDIKRTQICMKFFPLKRFVMIALDPNKTV